MVRTIIIIHPGGLGDLLLAVPALQKLRIRFPRHQLILCGQDEGASFLQTSHVVDDWISVQGAACAPLFDGSLPEGSPLQEWMARCDLVVAWSRDEAGTLAALKRSGAAEVLVQSPFDTRLRAVHQSDRFLETLQEPPATPTSAPTLTTPHHLRKQAMAYLGQLGLPPDRPLMIVHPGSGSRHKCLKPAIMASVIQRLEDQHVITLILEGPADHEMVSQLLAHVPSGAMRLHGLSLGLLAGMLSHVQCFLGHDSGVSHLSALLGVPTVTLFGPTDQRRWAPRGSQVTVLQGEACHCSTWELVSHCADRRCLQLSIDAILGACNAGLHDGRTPHPASRRLVS